MVGEDQVKSAYNSGNSAINAFNPQDIAGQTHTGFQNLFNTQQGQTNDYIQGYKNTIANNPTAVDWYQRGNQEYNVPTLNARANYLNTQVTNQLPMVQSMARGFDVAQNQVDNQVNQNLRYLQPQATAATNEAQTAQGLAAGYAGAGMEQNQVNLLPVQAQGQMLSDAFNRQMTGYTTEAQQRYEGLLAKMQQGVALSTAEMQELSKLAQAEQSYNAAQLSANATVKAAQIGANYQRLGPGDTLVNTGTNSAYNPFAPVRRI